MFKLILSEGMTILARVEAAGKRDSIAVVQERVPEKGLGITFESLIFQARTISSRIPRGIIAVALPITIEHIVLLLGIPESGVSTIMPLNPDFSYSEFEYFLGQGATLLISDGNEHAEAAATKLHVPIARIRLGSDGLVEFDSNPRQGSSPRSSPRQSPPLANHQQSESDIAVLLFTSGTTAAPKAVPLTHKNLLSSVDNILLTIPVTSADTTFSVMPLFHIHGIVASVLTALCAGSTVVVPQGGRFSARRFLSVLSKWEVTWFTAVPTIHQIVLRQEQEVDMRFPWLRFVRSSSSRLDPAVLQALEEKFGVPVIEAYAMTETSYQITSNPCDPERRVPGSVGCAHGSVEVKILNTIGDELPVGGCGEICVRGPNVMTGYLGNALATATAFTKDGFFRTGDEGCVDQKGFLTITGRIKEQINRGGEKISPAEIDAVVRAFPGVDEAYAFGYPDELYGESVGVAVVCRGDAPTEAQIREHVGNHLARFKVPSKIFFVDQLPKTATGKVQRTTLPKYFKLD